MDAADGGPGSSEARLNGRIRRIIALLLAATGIVLAVLDAVLPDYDVDPIQLGLFLGAALALLGVDFLPFWLKGR